MFSARNHHKLRKTRSRRVTSQSKKSKKTIQSRTSTTFSERLRKNLNDLRRPGSLVPTYTIQELEPICQQLAIEHMATTTLAKNRTDACPFTCLFCQNFIYEPLTLTCGHTFCDQCVKDESNLSTIHCPRCPDDLQNQVQSTIVYARENQFSRNHFLKEILQRCQGLKEKYQSLGLYQKGKTEHSNGNYLNAIEIFSQIIEKDPEHHLAFYGRAKSFAAAKRFEEALKDASKVISLRSQWTKGYLCQSEILFEMNRFTAALMSSLKALVIDPEDPFAKPIMARHLHVVLHNNDVEETDVTSDLPSPIFDEIQQPIVSNVTATEQRTISICKGTQSTDTSSSFPCFCTEFDTKELRPRDFECSICVNLLWFPISTPCGHVFCRECLIRSVDNTQIQCPICKTSLDKYFPMVIEFHVNKTEIISKIIETYFPVEYEECRKTIEQENVHGSAVSRFILNENSNSTTPMFEIPIFVCVLALPNCVCPLHVFEPRYRLMMRRTIETESRTFGMCTYDEQNDNFSDYGTLLFIRSIMYTQDGRSIVDTIGRRRFRVVARGMRDGYNTAKVVLIRDNPVEQHEFDDLFQLNRTTYDRVRQWFHGLDPYRRTLIARQLEGYPECDDLIQGSTDGPSWAWIMLNLLPIDPLIQYTALASQSFRIRLQIINDVIDFLNHQNQPENHVVLQNGPSAQ